MDGWLDKRDRNAIVEQMRELAKSYAPEWQFTPDQPDAGGTIAMIFANQTADTIKKMNQLLDKYQIEFVNMYGVSVRPAAPASAVAVMTLSESRREGTALEKGMQAVGQNEQGEEILYELQSDLYVTTAKIKAAFLVTYRDHLVIPYRENLPLFDYSRGKRKSQALYLYYRSFGAGGEISLKVTRARRGSLQEPAQLLADPGRFRFFYQTQDGLLPFQSVSCEKDTLLLQADTELSFASAVVIEAVGALAENIRVSDIRLIMNAGRMRPDLVVTDTGELNRETFLPFGRQFAVYQSCYIGQENLFGQAGAEATLSFDLSFAVFSTKVTSPEDADLRMIKKKKRKEYSPPAPDCRIQEVSLEYFNGIGFKKLDCGEDVSSLFADPGREGRRSIRFTIPADWEDTRQCGYERNFLRLQIVRADNCYLREVEYHYPVITDMEFAVQDSGGIRPFRVERVEEDTRTELTRPLLHGQEPVCFAGNPYDGNFFLIGLDARPKQGPVSVFFELGERMLHKDARIAFSYSASGGFQELRPVDGTDNLQHSGIITFMPPPDMKSMKIEGVDAFWIRLEDRQEVLSYSGMPYGDEASWDTDETEQQRCPVLKKMILNAVSVVNYEWRKEQNYYIDTIAKNMRFPLYCNRVISAQVWVNEIDALSAAEMEKLQDTCGERIRVEYSLSGRVEEFYVLWDEVESFAACSGTGKRAAARRRVYCLDRRTGELIFGNGRNAYVPNHTRGIAFKVRVLTCSGEKGNLPRGTIDRFRGNVFTIDEITNPVAAYGGADMESTKELLARGSLILGTGKRLVTKRDYEREALAFSDAIDKVSCVAGARLDQAGCGFTQDRRFISLALLMKDYRKGSYSFRNVCGRLKEHICAVCQITCSKERLLITEPVFAHICVKMWCEIPDMSKSMELKKEIQTVIDDYLEPTGAKGWQIGQLPTQAQLDMLLGTLEGPVHISARLFSVTYTDGGGRHETDLDNADIRNNPFMVCCSGKHEIYWMKEWE